MGGLRPEEVRERADGAIDEIIYVLTQPRDKLAAEYRDKQVQPKRLIKEKPIFR